MEMPHVSIDGYEHISSVVEKTNTKLEDIRTGRLKPLLTSIRKETDKIGGFYPSDQIVIAARTGMGKTAKVIHMMRDFVNPVINPYYVGKIVILYDTWEMAAWRSVLRMYSRESQMSVKTMLNFQNPIAIETMDRLKIIGNSFNRMPIFMSNISQTSKQWGDSKRRIKDKNPNTTFVNIIDHSRLVTKTNQTSEEALISDFMKEGMKIKNEQEDINIYLSQMNRNIENNAGGRGEIGKALPVASDLFGSDAVFQCADVVMALHRPGYYRLRDWEGIPTGITDDANSNDHLMLECLLKQRDGWTGNLTLRHDLALNQILDYE